MYSRVLSLNDATFDARTTNKIELTVVYVGTNRCDSTKSLAPALEDLSAEYARTVRFARVDFDESPEFAKAHDVTGVPTVLPFKRNTGCEQDIIACGIGAAGTAPDTRRDAIKDAINRFV